MANNPKIDVYLVCNAKYHDTNFARLEILKLLAENEDIHTRVAEDFSDIEAIQNAGLLITYTCDLRPSLDQQAGLAQYLEAGGRWFALHATNALIEFVNGKPDTPDLAPNFMAMLGSRFVAHPSNTSFEVRVTDVDHPLTAGINDFEVRDSQPQMYLHPFGEGEVLYLSLGHCTGKHDMKPMVEVVPVIRGSWNNPVYYELLRRGIRWGVAKRLVQG